MFLLFALVVLLVPLRWVFALIMAMCIHELGHYGMLCICGVHVDGVVVTVHGMRMKVSKMSRMQELLCALAGPMAGFSLIIFARWMPRTVICGCIQSVYNLLPIYPLDGGRIIRCLGIGQCARFWIERICLVLFALVGFYGSFILRLGVLPMMIGVLMIQRVLVGKGLENRC